MQAETSGHNKDSYPKWSVITFDFPANDKRPAVKAFWYDGGKRPPDDCSKAATSRLRRIARRHKGKIYSPGDYCDHFDVHRQRESARGRSSSIRRATSPNGSAPSRAAAGHVEFPRLRRPADQTILLGNLAVWVAATGKGEKSVGPKNLKVKNISGLEEIIQPVYRKGYAL